MAFNHNAQYDFTTAQQEDAALSAEYGPMLAPYQGTLLMTGAAPVQTQEAHLQRAYACSARPAQTTAPSLLPPPLLFDVSTMGPQSHGPGGMLHPESYQAMPFNGQDLSMGYSEPSQGQLSYQPHAQPPYVPVAGPSHPASVRQAQCAPTEAANQWQQTQGMPHPSRRAQALGYQMQPMADGVRLMGFQPVIMAQRQGQPDHLAGHEGCQSTAPLPLPSGQISVPETSFVQGEEFTYQQTHQMQGQEPLPAVYTFDALSESTPNQLDQGLVGQSQYVPPLYDQDGGFSGQLQDEGLVGQSQYVPPLCHQDGGFSGQLQDEGPVPLAEPHHNALTQDQVASHSSQTHGDDILGVPLLTPLAEFHGEMQNQSQLPGTYMDWQDHFPDLGSFEPAVGADMETAPDGVAADEHRHDQLFAPLSTEQLRAGHFDLGTGTVTPSSIHSNRTVDIGGQADFGDFRFEGMPNVPVAFEHLAQHTPAAAAEAPRASQQPTPPSTGPESLQSRRHLCHECGKGFASVANLRSHLRVHKPAKKRCHLCEKLFKDEKDLLRHRRSVHKEKQPYKCESCGKEGARKDNMQRHAAKCAERMAKRKERLEGKKKRS